MPVEHTGRLELAYEQRGRAEDPAVLLIMGYGVQMIAWPDELIDALTAQGFRVVWFDNRDVGLSQKFPDLGQPDVPGTIARRWAGLRAPVPYRLSDMADDAISLLDHLGISQAHVVGMSMGGMIAQQVAIRHPERVLSLCSWASMTGARTHTIGSPSVLATMLRRPPTELEQRIEWNVRLWQQIGSSAYPTDPSLVRARTEASYRRSSYVAGIGRQFGAILAAHDRSPRLATVRQPALVIHGREDPLVPVRGGVATARALRQAGGDGATLRLVDGYSHDLPVQLMPTFATWIAENARRAH
mgnify:CR=1 FL=1